MTKVKKYVNNPDFSFENVAKVGKTHVSSRFFSYLHQARQGTCRNQHATGNRPPPVLVRLDRPKISKKRISMCFEGRTTRKNCTKLVGIYQVSCYSSSSWGPLCLPRRPPAMWCGVQVSSAASALCVWVHAIYLYANVAKDVAPKRARLKEAQVRSYMYPQRCHDMHLHPPASFGGMIQTRLLPFPKLRGQPPTPTSGRKFLGLPRKGCRPALIRPVSHPRKQPRALLGRVFFESRIIRNKSSSLSLFVVLKTREPMNIPELLRHIHLHVRPISSCLKYEALSLSTQTAPRVVFFLLDHPSRESSDINGPLPLVSWRASLITPVPPSIFFSSAGDAGGEAGGPEGSAGPARGGRCQGNPFHDSRNWAVPAAAPAIFKLVSVVDLGRGYPGDGRRLLSVSSIFSFGRANKATVRLKYSPGSEMA